jgi:hypothetical protein
MKYIGLFLFFLTVSAQAEVKWDIPVDKFGEVTGKIYLMNLTVGDEAKIDKYSRFCTTQNNSLAISSTTEVGSGEYLVKLLPGNKLRLQVPDEDEFLKAMVSDESYASCEWWTAHKGQYILIIDNINGKKSISSLGKSHNK